MYNSIFVLLVICSTIFVVSQAKQGNQNPYCQNYTEGCQEANTWIKQHQQEIQNQLSNPAFEISIVFPEISRHKVIQDKIEISGLKALYIRFGPQYADFSVGRFQMKPSWAAKIETLSQQYRLKTAIVCKESTPKLNRTLRVNRLSDYRWQLKYLEAFYRIVKKRYPEHANDLNFLATVYNVGLVDTKTIKKWQSIKAFPSGNRHNANQYSYGSVSKMFYQTQKIF